MGYHFTNLVFEGGGVKGVAYVGAMQALQERDILPRIRRAGGASAGAIHALLLALRYTPEEMRQLLWQLDFRTFEDDSPFVLRDIARLLRDYGWHKGKTFLRWVGDILSQKTGDREITFKGLMEKDEFLELYLIGANLSTRFSEIFSHEHTPDMPVAEAVRISMSIPLFFTVRRRSDAEGREHVYVDGSVLDNYPVKLFDQVKYIEKQKHKKEVNYYVEPNRRLGAKGGNRFVYNKETLGFRLDSRREINVFGGQKPKHHRIGNMIAYSWALIDAMMESQENQHLHSDDWQRTVYIDTLGVGTRDFDIANEMKQKLVTSGQEGVRAYFEWYDAAGKKPVNKI